jgi:hypothetical protein
MIKVIATYDTVNYELYKLGVLDGILFAMYSKKDETIIREIQKLRQQHPDILIYIDNGAFSLFVGARPSYQVIQRYKNFNIIDHVERYRSLVKFVKPHWAPIPLDFIIVDSWRYAKDELEANYTYTMSMNKRFSIEGLVPVVQISTKIPLDKYISDLKDCKMDRCCIGGISTSTANLSIVAKFVRALQQHFPGIKIHIFGRGPTWFVPLDILGVYSTDNNSLAEWAWIKFKDEILTANPKLGRIPVKQLRMLVIRDLADKLRLVKVNGYANSPNTVISLS